MVKPRSRTKLIINTLIALPVVSSPQTEAVTNKLLSNILWRVDIAEEKRQVFFVGIVRCPISHNRKLSGLFNFRDDLWRNVIPHILDNLVLYRFGAVSGISWRILEMFHKFYIITVDTKLKRGLKKFLGDCCYHAGLSSRFPLNGMSFWPQKNYSFHSRFNFLPIFIDLTADQWGCQQFAFSLQPRNSALPQQKIYEFLTLRLHGCRTFHAPSSKT